MREAFVSVRRPNDWPAVLERWYADDLPGCHPPAEAGRERLGSPVAKKPAERSAFPRSSVEHRVDLVENIRVTFHGGLGG